MTWERTDVAWFRLTVFWLGIILTSLTWRFAFHLVTAPETDLALLASLIGISCFVGCGAISHARPLRIRSPIPGAVAAVVVLLVTGASTGVLLRVAPALHDIDVPAALLPALDAISPRLGLCDGLVTFWDGGQTHMVRITFEGLGLYEMWYIGVGATAAGLVFGGHMPGCTRAGARAIAGAAAVLIAYALVRFVSLAAIAVEFGRCDLLWRPEAAVASYLPMAPVMARFCGHAPAAPGVSLRGVIAAAAMALALLAGTVFPARWAPGDWGSGTPLRVTIDESHSNWEWTAEPFDTASFGIRAEYNYCCFATLLGEHHDVGVLEQSVTAASLRGTDVLIIKTPTSPYDAAEIDAICAFVGGGGGLLLIGDHNNLFGMATHLNAIAGRFGMRFRCDDTFDLATGGFSSLLPLGFWTHPLVGDIGGFGFLTSCTVEGGLGIEPIMVGVGLGSEHCDYGHPNFFGNISYDLADRFGVFLQAAARRWGAGKVLLFTDSTCFSNFCMFSPGTSELALRFVDYLGCGRPGRAAGGRARCRQVVLVDTTHSHASFFDCAGYRGRPAWRRFEELYISVSRMGMNPVGGGIADLENLRPAGLIIVNPRKRFGPAEVEAIVDFVSDGGRLLMLDSIMNPESCANQLLGFFEMGIVPTPLAGSRGRARAGAFGAGTSPELEVLGGEALATDSSGRVVAARAVCGYGAIIVAVDSYAYSEAALGRPLQPAYAYRPSRASYRALFDLLEELL
jgi:hypothetical protein